MRLFDKNVPRVIAFAFVAMMMVSARSYANRITCSTDTLRMTGPVGVWTTGPTIYISDGRDSTIPAPSPLTQVNVWVTGSSTFALATDSVLDFYGNAPVIVIFNPTNTSTSTAVLHVEGDSNEITVVLIGNPPSHQNLSFTGDRDLGLLTPGVTQCDSVILYNPNAFSVSITSLTIAEQHASCQLEDVPTLPYTLDAQHSITFHACVTAEPDSGRDTLSAGGTIVADYTFTNGSDAADFTISGYVLPLDSTCLSIGYPIDFGGCYDGATSSQPVDIANTTSGDVIVDSIKIVNGDTAAFQIPTSQFPMTLHGGSSGSFNASFSPPNTGAQGEQLSAGIVIYSSGKSKGGFPCTELAGTLVGEAQVLLVDTIVLNAPPGGANTLTISTNRTMSRHAIYINNDTTVAISPISLQITDSTQDAYFGSVGNEIANIYDSLIPPNANPYRFNPIIMTLDAPDTGTYDIDMSLTYDVLRAYHKTQITSQLAYQYHIAVHRVPAASSSVSESAHPSMDFSLMPNPARGDVTISLPTGVNSTVEIYNIVGSLLLRQQVNGSFVWNGETATGDVVPDGAYIVRVSEASSGGVTSTSSKRLMIMR